MLMCKQAEKGVPLQAEQADWLEDTDEEVDEQELEAHYMYMAKIQEVHTTDSTPSFDAEPLEKVHSNDDYNVFANERQHSEQPVSINNTCLVENVDSNVILDSLDMCDNDNQADQNAEECDDEGLCNGLKFGPGRSRWNGPALPMAGRLDPQAVIFKPPSSLGRPLGHLSKNLPENTIVLPVKEQIIKGQQQEQPLGSGFMITNETEFEQHEVGRLWWLPLLQESSCPLSLGVMVNCFSVLANKWIKRIWFDMLRESNIEQDENNIIRLSTVMVAKKVKELIKKDKLTITDLKGVGLEMLKSRYKNYIELEYHIDQMKSAMSDEAKWSDAEDDLTKP
ncbi:hypothetical protein Tco_1123348 [Tanacetum coccineum]|uniref:Uncharacterized protein n=1 Tax=Tanacetum coccineum TaxID=301880 RepID=A0ABQ5J616_9ASTR